MWMYWFVWLLLPVVAFATNLGECGHCGLMSDAEYEIITKIALSGNYDVPTHQRSKLEKTALRRYYRNRDRYTVKMNPVRLYHDGKEVLSQSKYRRVVIDGYHPNKGIGARGLHQILMRQYTGISERSIYRILATVPEYCRANAKFKNKAPLKHVTSNSVHETLQIDLVDMQRQAVVHKNSKRKYILSIMDIFSRYVWLRDLPRKSADAVANHLKLIFRDFGCPKVIQHDQGKEFDGHVKHLLKRLHVKNIKSRPYHPQSQGKVERMHKSLKGKIAYDLAHASPFGINWAKQLPEYQRILNNTPKECLAWKTPHDIYYGRNLNVVDSLHAHVSNVKKLRNKAKTATMKCHRRTDKSYGKRCNTPKYNIGDPVFLLFRKGGLNRKRRVLKGKIVQRSVNSNMYKLKYYLPNSSTEHSKGTETKWYHVSDITKTDLKTDNRKIHKQRYYIPLTQASRLDDLRADFGLSIEFNPTGNGNCQFSAVAHQLHQHGIFRSEDTLRHDVVTFLRLNPLLGNQDTGRTPWANSVLENSDAYLARMATNFEYGDQITMQAISQLYNIQIVIVSTSNRQTTLISPDGSSAISDDIPLIVLGHYPEDSGEHYVSLQHNHEILRTIIAGTAQIQWNTTDETQSNNLVTSSDLVDHDNRNDYGDLDQSERVDYSDRVDNRHDLPDRHDSPCHLKSRLMKLKEVINKKRQPKPAKKNVELPLLPIEIWYTIIGLVLKQDPSQRYTLKRVSRLFLQIVNETPTPRLYLAPDRFRHITVWPISVRKIISIAGSHSGLVMAIRDIIKHSSWANAWLYLRLFSFCGWYEVTRIWYRRKRY